MKFQCLGMLSQASLFVWLRAAVSKSRGSLSVPYPLPIHYFLRASPGGEENVLADGQDGLHGNVHNHHALGSEVEGQHLEGVSNQQAREPDVVEETEQPDEDQ